MEDAPGSGWYIIPDARSKVFLRSLILDCRISSLFYSVRNSSPEEFLMHVIERELDLPDPAQGESEEEIRKKMEGLGY